MLMINDLLVNYDHQWFQGIFSHTQDSRWTYWHFILVCKQIAPVPKLWLLENDSNMIKRPHHQLSLQKRSKISWLTKKSVTSVSLGKKEDL